MNPQNSPTSSDNPGVGGVTESRSTLAETKTQIAQTARDAATKVKGAASTAAARAKEEAERFASDKKETAAGRIGNYSSAIHETARSLEEKDPNIAWFTHQAADKLQGVADYMRHRDLSNLRQDVEDIARRHPAAFFGGMFLVGLLAGNVVKASQRKLDESPQNSLEPDRTSDWSEEARDARIEGTADPYLTNAQRSAAGI